MTTQTFSSSGTFTSDADQWVKCELWGKGGIGGDDIGALGGGGAGAAKVTVYAQLVNGGTLGVLLSGGNASVTQSGVTIGKSVPGGNASGATPGTATTTGCIAIGTGATTEPGVNGTAPSGAVGGAGGAGGGSNGGAGGAGGTGGGDGAAGTAPGGGNGGAASGGSGAVANTSRVLITHPVSAPTPAGFPLGFGFGNLLGSGD